ncbi:hypothetical protein HPB49_007891 [Dermacentor silvarum]|uniref:Uncharacterized protein n=1 Tax=Dermacentor silvarum TaxID=543639 RepID=A0ACB8DXH4_DERSI|nr:hypothetical protein HPB49_007891 [Dermacentor silvarum]
MMENSIVATGAVLQKYISSEVYSRTLQSAERSYSVFDRELLVIHATITFATYWSSSKLHVLTNHKPSPCVFSTNTSKNAAGEIRHLAQISEFTTGIQLQHVKGADNRAADALSRDAAVDSTSTMTD